ncbi:MAG: biopolymer transporter ExbD [Elusimicrobia bacterium]|nr:biopolymer transporter ExbD [Elusimicrobiota bacterium]
MKKLEPIQGAITDINVTPLVDVCLVLVIIFMVLAPMAMQAGIEVASSRKGAAKAVAALKENVVVVLDAKGGVKVNGRAVRWEELPGALKSALEASKDKMLSLDASPKANVGQVVEILDASKQGGAKKLALLNPS